MKNIRMKYILVIGDGMADDAIPELDNKTPLQFAQTPTLDKLASAGIVGTALTIPKGMQAGSDTAILSIFGCDPEHYFSGRAPLEAAAVGIELSPGDVAYRCNMVTFEDADIPFEEKKILSHSAGSIDGAESDMLICDLFNTPIFKAAAEKAGLRVYPGSSFRHYVVQTAPDMKGVELIPPHDHLDEVLGQYLPGKSSHESKNAVILEDLMRLAHEILNSHPVNNKRRADGKLPANGIWFWANGTALELPSFTKRYGKTGSVISAVPLCQGIGLLIGLNKIVVEGATGELNTNYEGKTDAAFEALKTRDFVTIHIEAPDECTHSGDLKGKLQAIEWVDSRVVAPLVKRLTDNKIDFKMLIMSDHRTLTSTRGHDGAPVPFIIYDSRTDNNTGVCFCETDSENGELIIGTKLMSLLFEEK